MKNILKLITIVFLVIILSGCESEKKALTKDELINRLSEQGFIVNDSTMQIEDENINFVASANNNLYQIEIYIFDELEYAKQAYLTNKESFINLSSKKGKEKTSDNYEKYTQILTDTYNLVIRVENTLIYSVVSKDYKNDLNKVIKNIGY